MATYRLDLIFSGRDRVSGVIGGIAGSLSRMGRIMGGILGARMLIGIANGIRDIGVNAVESTALVQRMQITLESLLAREYTQQLMNQGIESMSTLNGIARAQFGALTDAANGMSQYNQAVATVTPEAERLMESLAQYAILSPYTYESTTQTFRQAMAFGFAAKEAEEFTKATLNMAAGIGADNSMLDRMAYNLAQIRLQGKVTALDIRQLALAGFDLRSVLKYVGDEMGVTIKDHLDFNAAIKDGRIEWEDFSRLYAEYAEKNFGGASERLARTLFGLKSTFSDVFALTMPKVLGPAAEVATDFLNRVLDAFINLRDSGLLEQIGAEWAETTRKWTTSLTIMWTRFDKFKSLMKTGLYEVGTALNMADLVPPDVGKAIDTIADRFDEVKYTLSQVFADFPKVDIWYSVGQGIKFVAEHINEFTFALGVLATSRAVSIMLTIVSLFLSLGASIAAPITLIIAAIGALYLAWINNFGGIQEIVATAWANIQLAFNNAVGIISGIMSEISEFFAPFKAELDEHLPGAIEVFKSIFGTIGPVISSVIAAILPPITRLWDAFKQAIPAIAKRFGFLIEFIKYFAASIGIILVGVIGVISGFVSGIISGLTPIFNAFQIVQEGLGNILLGIGNAFKGLFDFIAGIVTGDLQRIGEGFIGFFTGLWTILVGLFQTLGGMIAGPLGFVIEFIRGFVEGIIGFFTNLYNTLVGHSIIPDLVNGIQSLFQSMVTFISDVVSIGFDFLLALVTQVADTMMEGLQSAFTVIINVGQMLWDKIAIVRDIFRELIQVIQIVREKIVYLINKVKELVAVLGNISIPEAFQKGSPSPFEISMTDAAAALQNLIHTGVSWNRMDLNMPGSLGSTTPGVSGQGFGPLSEQTPQTVENHFHFQNTDLDPSSLAYALDKAFTQ